jgi:6,7-dimethyl-8-ribityllumazine synthase
MKVGIVVSRFHSDITSRLLGGAVEACAKSGVKRKNTAVVSVPGSFEIPLALERLARTRKFDALVALGCIIKGETAHNAYISYAVSDGIMEVMLDHLIPVGFGVLTPNTIGQARERSKGRNNKGKEATHAALEMALQAKRKR